MYLIIVLYVIYIPCKSIKNYSITHIRRRTSFEISGNSLSKKNESRLEEDMNKKIIKKAKAINIDKFQNDSLRKLQEA